MPDASVTALEEFLVLGEQERAARFHFAHDRNAYVIAHAVLRKLLQNYLGEPDVAFTIGTHGKPSLPPSHSLRFNLAHTRGLGLLAFCRDQEIGVDVEWQGRANQLHEIAKRYFTQNEQQEIAALPPTEQKAGFFRIWTRKEAILKACGRGLSISPEKIDVSTDPIGNPAVSVCPKEIAPEGGWALWDLRPALEYVGALALPQGQWTVRTWHYPEPRE